MLNETITPNDTDVVKYGKIMLLTDIAELDKIFLEKITFAIVQFPDMAISFNSKTMFRVHGSLTHKDRVILHEKLTDLQKIYDTKKRDYLPARKIGN